MYAMAHALHRMERDVCGSRWTEAKKREKLPVFFNSSKLCPQLSPSPDGKMLLDYIRNVSFVSEFTKSMRMANT